MVEERRQPMTEEQIQAFARKLSAWVEGLTPMEQAFVREMVARAAAAGDVQGFSASTPLTDLSEWVAAIGAIALADEAIARRIVENLPSS